MDIDTDAGLRAFASQFKTFDEFSNAISQESLRPLSWHIADENYKLDPTFEPTDRLGGKKSGGGLFVGSPEFWQDYAVGRNLVIVYDLTDLNFTTKPLSDTGADFFADQSGNQGFFVKPSAFPKLNETGRYSIEEAIERASRQQRQMPQSREQARAIWDASRRTS